MSFNRRSAVTTHERIRKILALQFTFFLFSIKNPSHVFGSKSLTFYLQAVVIVPKLSVWSGVHWWPGAVCTWWYLYRTQIFAESRFIRSAFRTTMLLVHQWDNFSMNIMKCTFQLFVYNFWNMMCYNWKCFWNFLCLKCHFRYEIA